MLNCYPSDKVIFWNKVSSYASNIKFKVITLPEASGPESSGTAWKRLTMPAVTALLSPNSFWNFKKTFHSSVSRNPLHNFFLALLIPNNWLKFYKQPIKTILKLGCRHSSVDSSAPTILPPQVCVPSTPSTLLPFIVFVLYLSCEKKENKQKEARRGPIF